MSKVQRRGFKQVLSLPISSLLGWIGNKIQLVNNQPYVLNLSLVWNCDIDIYCQGKLIKPATRILISGQLLILEFVLFSYCLHFFLWIAQHYVIHFPYHCQVLHILKETSPFICNGHFLLFACSRFSFDSFIFFLILY